MRKLFLPLLTAFLVLLSGCSSVSAPAKPKTVEQPAILVSAAISLKDALADIQTKYQHLHPGTKISFNYGSSGALEQQIAQGAPADLFVSAGQSQMDQLDKQGLLLPQSRVKLLANSLVLVTRKDNHQVSSLLSLNGPEVSKLSIGYPETVPAGKYAQEALTNLKLWTALQSKLVLAKDVRQVLNYVETGNAEAGIVYLSDSLGSDKVKVVEQFAATSHSPIIYPAAIIKNTQQPDAARDFLNYLQTPEVRKIFEHYGFQRP